VLVPVLAALAGAAVYGITGVLQQRAAHRVQGSPTDQGRFAKGLIRQPVWLFSTIGSVAGFGLQGLALGTGPIVLVQPVLVTGLLFAGVTGFAVRRRHVDWPFFGALLLTAAGLAVFLVLARPSKGSGSPGLGRVLPLGIGLAVLLVACVLWSVFRARGISRSLTMALAAGIDYGVTAAVAKLTIAAFSAGFVAGITHWSTWALVVLGPLGFVLNQNAFREGELASPAVAVITVTDPLVGIAVGMLWLHEVVASSAGAITGEVLALAAMAGGVWLVAHRTPQVADGDGDGGRPGHADQGGKGTGDGDAGEAAGERHGRTASAARP
jgi:drug/metabolite transporter (DMT)-like permease